MSPLASATIEEAKRFLSMALEGPDPEAIEAVRRYLRETQKKPEDLGTTQGRLDELYFKGILKRALRRPSRST